MNYPRIATTMSAVAFLFASHSAFAAGEKCELDRPIVFAGLDWDSNALHTEIASFIIENGYGCETDIIPGSTIPLLNGMIRGDIDVTMEMWRDNVVEIYDPAVEEGLVFDLGTNFPDATQQWYVPKYLVEGDDAPAPDLKSVSDLAKYKELFADQEEPDKGRFYNCVLGWGCETVNSKKYYAYGLDDDFTNFRPGSSGAFSAAIEGALLKKQPVFFYYWAPTWLIGKIGDELVQLEEPAYDAEIWQKLQDTENPEDVTQATAYPVVKVTVSVSGPFHDEAPKLVEFLTNYETTAKMVSTLLAWMQNNDGTPELGAKEFLASREDVWTKWVPDDVAQKVRDALADS